MIEFDASFGLHAIVLAAIIDEFMIDEKRLFDYTQMSMRADGLYYTVFLMSSRPVGSLGDSYQKTLQRPLSLWGGIAPPPPPMDPPLLATVVTFRSLCKRTTGCVCLSSVSNSSAAQSNSSSWTQIRGF